MKLNPQSNTDFTQCNLCNVIFYYNGDQENQIVKPIFGADLADLAAISATGVDSAASTCASAASTGAASTGAASTGAASTGAASMGAASTGAASTGAASTGAASTGAASTGAGAGTGSAGFAFPWAATFAMACNIILRIKLARTNSHNLLYIQS